MVTQEDIDCRLASAELRGEANAKREMAKGFRDVWVSMDNIAKQSGLSEEVIKGL